VPRHFTRLLTSVLTAVAPVAAVGCARSAPAPQYELRIAPGYEPAGFAVNFPGVSFVEVDQAGDLLLHTGAETIRRSRPRAYQETGGQRRVVDARFDLNEDGAAVLRLGPHDRALPIVVAPGEN
jgi:hypothetical protein